MRWLLLFGALIVALLLAATLGAPVPLSDLWSQDATRAEVAQRIFWRFGGEWGLRPVRLLAWSIGRSVAGHFGCGVAGGVRNPLAEPYLLGISAGGALGAAVGVALQDSSSLRVLDNSLFDASAVLALLERWPLRFWFMPWDNGALPERWPLRRVVAAYCSPVSPFRRFWRR
jgi:iron complex transport system permease protein